MLVDLQVMRRVSPALDLNYFLYSSLNGPDRKNGLEEFLRTYYASFSSTLEAGEAPVPFTQEELLQEFRKYMIYGCLTGLFLIPVVLSEVEDVPEFEGVTSDNIEEFSKEFQKTMIKMSQRDNCLLKSRLLDMFDEMTEAGIIT